MPKQDNPIKAITFVCTAFALFAVMGMFSKLLAGIHHPLELSFYRNLVALIPACAFIVIKKRYDILKVKRPITMLGRTIIGTIALLLTLAAMQEIPLADATVLFFISTLLTPVFAVIFLKEIVGIQRWAAVFIGLAGVIIVAQPSGNTTIMGIAFALGAGTGHALVHIFLRLLKNENTFTTTFYFYVAGFLIPIAFMPFIATIPTPESIMLLLGIGITGSLAQYFLTTGFSMAEASLLSPFNYTGLLWATLFDITIWQVAPSLNVWIGASLIITANLYIIYRTRKKRAA